MWVIAAISILISLVLADEILDTSGDVETEEQQISLSSCLGLTWGSVMSDDVIIQTYEAKVVELKEKGLEPALSIKHLEKYRKLPLMDCHIERNDGNLAFRVDLPTRTIGSNYQLYDFIPGGGSFSTDEGVVCTFEYPTKAILDGKSGIIPLTKEMSKECDTKGLCEVPPIHDADVADTVCLQAILDGKTGKGLVPFCKFQCDTQLTKTASLRKEISESSYLSWILK